MAYNTKYTITFKDLNNTTRTIYIAEDGFSGSVTPLTPGKDPIVWYEDSSEDLNRRVRGITGRLEVIEHEYGDLADLYPTTPLQYRVTCQNVFWGYIKAENSTSPWESGPRALKFNILSPLALAYDIPMPINTTLGMREVGDVMKELMNTLGYSYVSMPKGSLNYLGDFFRGEVRGMLICPYADDKDYHYANNNEIFAPISCGEFIEALCIRHDLMVHDAIDIFSADLVFSRFLDTDGIYRWSLSDITSGNYGTADALITPPIGVREIATDFTIAGNDNSEALVKPYSRVDIANDGDVNREDIHFPTVQSEYNTSVDMYHLTPRGIWLNNVESHIKLGNFSSSTSDKTENFDCLYFKDQTIGAGTKLFSITFYNIERDVEYRLKIKYAHKKDDLHDAIGVSARGKGGWYGYGAGSGNTHPIYSNELITPLGLDGETQYPNDIYEISTNLFMYADDYITINFYVYSNGNNLTNLYFTDIYLEASQAGEYTYERWEEQPFVKRLSGSAGSKPLKIARLLNDAFFSNFYETDYEFFYEYTYLLSSQRRLQLTVSGGTLSKMWYLYNYIFEDDNESWRVVAISYDVRNAKYKITLHQMR